MLVAEEFLISSSLTISTSATTFSGDLGERVAVTTISSTS